MTQGQHRVVLLLGAPGAGKGTQARFIAEVLTIPHVASGDLLREHRRLGTPLGRAAQGYMDRGDLVPDDLVVAMIAERLERPDASHGALLDGFPRTSAQAQILDSSLIARGDAVRAALYLDVPREVLIERLAGRWICSTCQATYHERFSRPATEGFCTVCGGELYQRTDDRREVVENRVEVYLRETLPVIGHYAAHGVLRRVDGGRAVEDVRADLCVMLGGAVRGKRRDRWHLFVEHELSIDQAGLAHRLVRTLCGKYVPRFNGRETGSIEAFEATPCRECWRALRSHGLKAAPAAENDGAPAPTAPSDALGLAAL